MPYAPVIVRSESAASPTLSSDTGSNIAPAGTDTLESADPGISGTAKLRKLIVSATTQGKWELRLKANGVQGATLATFYTSPFAPPAVFEPPSDEFVTLTLAAGADAFQVVFTNREPVGGSTADIAANFFWSL